MVHPSSKKDQGSPMKAYIFLAFFFLGGCGTSSLSDLRQEGEFQTKKLAEELRQIETREDLDHSLPKLRRRFNKLADVLVEARRYSEYEPSPSEISEELFLELARLYEMPGGREAIETAQLEAIQRLRE
jgi:hypothetical protein